MTRRIELSAADPPVAELLMVMAGIEPDLAPAVILQCLRRAAARPDGWRRVAAAVTERPELLTGAGASAGPLGVLRFISALLDAGARTVAAPSCPRCGQVRPLGAPVDGLRVCAGCLKKSRALRCGRCGKVRSTARRDDDGQPICQACWWRDSRCWKDCVSCGRARRVAAITEAGPVCQLCRPRPDLPCGICGSTVRIGISRATGTPVCDRCRKRWIVCSRCGTGAPLKGGTPDEPLCARCVNPDPAFWKRCAVCGSTWQLSTVECTRCSLDRRLEEIFASPDGAAAPQLDLLREALVGTDRPDSVLTWLTRSGVRDTLAAAACGQHALTHELLDDLPPGGTVEHLRSMLVATGALPARDEHLAAAQRWISQVIAEQTSREHRQLLHSYAVWHLLRRLRGRLDGKPANRAQADSIRQNVAAAQAFLNRLDEQGLTLATCTQAHLDQWLASCDSRSTRSTGFVRWAVAHRHASGLSAPAKRWTGPTGPIDDARRWDDARRLLHDDRYTTADRVAGLLVLLYAQKLNTISALTLNDVLHDGEQTLLRLGERPVALPAPLDALVETLIAARHIPGAGVIKTSSDWLFPGRWPGRHLSEDTLARRLHAIDVHPRAGRNAALFSLATEIPAAILAKTLGIHIKGAVHWQKLAAGDWNTYAADVGTKPNRHGPQ